MIKFIVNDIFLLLFMWFCGMVGTDPTDSLSDRLDRLEDEIQELKNGYPFVN